MLLEEFKSGNELVISCFCIFDKWIRIILRKMDIFSEEEGLKL
jgi:hypothetical protein